MKVNKYILLAFAVLALASCYEDKSTGATLPLSDIFISEEGLQKVYNINKNDTLVIEPIITQAHEELELSYTWELDQKVVSTEKNFHYVGDILGTYNGRLIVENEDGKAFFVFKLHVNSPYEYGITVLSKDADGRPHIAFMQDPLEGTEREFYDENCLQRNNLTQFFASNPSDIVQTKGTLIVACQGNDTEEDGAAIYFLNEKTFVMENIVESKEYKTFKPTKLFTPEESYDGSAYPVLSADGKMYSLPTYNAVLQPSHNLLSTYAQTGFVVGNATNNDILLWDSEVNGLVCIYNSYGPYYCGNKYLLTREYLDTDQYYKDKFSKLKGVISLTPIKKTSTQTNQSRRELIVLAQAEDGSIQRLVIATFFWRKLEGTVSDYEILTNGGNFAKASSTSYSVINENTPFIANDTYKTMLFANGNKVMKWKYLGDDWLDDAVEIRTVGSKDAIITSFEISADHMQTYVAFYEPNQEGMNGSVWVLDTNEGKVLEKHNNVCYEPVKIIYKKKNDK